ncbi:MAG TPA: M23 family metallopeptidase [Candidatus Limnocylindria bacterium]|nr:M23 family metallopeptidase [Candidatus Limnocylindria bacterium]
MTRTVLGIIAAAIAGSAAAAAMTPADAAPAIDAVHAARRAEHAALAARSGVPADERARADARAGAAAGPALLEAAEARYVALAAETAERAGAARFSGRLAWPHRGPISSPFAPRWGGFHNGLDIAAPFFTPVAAAADGVVTVVGRPYAAVGDTAVTVMISHGDGVSTVYVHLDDRRPPIVTVGQRVTTGETIAFVGSTGWSTGPHTHFMAVVNGRAVDPLRYLPAQ